MLRLTITVEGTDEDVIFLAPKVVTDVPTQQFLKMDAQDLVKRYAEPAFAALREALHARGF